jgi:SAM-dependent methyltransferase
MAPCLIRLFSGACAVINLASLARMCLLSAVVALAPAAGLTQPEPTWEVFDEKRDKTPPSVAKEMLKLANVAADDVVYDLGCGDGVIVIAAAEDFGARGMGVDTNPKVLARARSNAEKHNVADKTTFVGSDLFKTDLKPATVITLFLWPTMNIKLRPRLLELAPGTRIVSHEHSMGSWQPDRVKNAHHKTWGPRPLYLWVVPARIAGNWLLSIDGREHSVQLRQTFQRFSGSAATSGRSWRIRNGLIDGARVQFDMAPATGEWKRYSGIVTADGVLEGSGWRAQRSS